MTVIADQGLPVGVSWHHHALDRGRDHGAICRHFTEWHLDDLQPINWGIGIWLVCERWRLRVHRDHTAGWRNLSEHPISCGQRRRSPNFPDFQYELLSHGVV